MTNKKFIQICTEAVVDYFNVHRDKRISWQSAKKKSLQYGAAKHFKTTKRS